MDERKLEIRVGALALVALAVVVGLVMMLSGGLRGDRTRLHADFGYAGGLPDGAMVRFAGVKVGRVTGVVFQPDARDPQGRSVPVRIVFDIDASAARALRSDATATVGTQGALGESHLELLPGTSSEPLPNGVAVRGLDPPRLDVLLARMSGLLESSVNDDAFRNFLVEVGNFARRLNVFVGNNRDELSNMWDRAGMLLTDGQVAMADARVVANKASKILANPALETMIEDLALTAQAAREDLPVLMSDAKTLLAKLDRTVGAVTDEDVAKLRTTLAKLDEVATQLRTVSNDAGALLAGLENGEGTAGLLMKDPQVYNDMRALLSDLKSHPWKLVWKK